MKLRLKLGIVLVCLTFWTGCSILPELVAPAANFAIGFYDYKEVCEREKGVLEKVEDKVRRLTDE